jgi:uncharacterized protein (TIGR02679 family)
MTERHPTPPSLAELRGEGWQRLLAAARRRLERTGGSLDGSVGLTRPSEAERRTVIGITGRYRPENAARIDVSLTVLDRALRERHSRGLAETLAALDGPLRDRPAERDRENEARANAVRRAASSPLTAEPWYAAWLTALQDDGTLTRLVRRDDTHLLDHAVAVLERLHRQAPGTALPLPVLAEWTTGDTKALAPGAPLAGVVLRALAHRAGLPAVPRDRAGRRTLWESAGAVPDDLASQVLVLNLRCAPGGAVAGWLNQAADAGIPFRATLQQLTASPVRPLPTTVHVCENPAVLRLATAELGPHSPPLLCTEGIPSTACNRLAAAAAESGARLLWRADFDWTGLRITTAARTAHGAHPWRMTAADYTGALDHGDSTPLTGTPAPSPWDPGLATAMAAQGRAVMEERLLDLLLADLADRQS